MSVQESPGPKHRRRKAQGCCRTVPDPTVTIIVGSSAGTGFAALVHTDLLNGIKGAHGADVASKGALAFDALYRWAPRLARWMHQRRMMSPFVMGYVVPYLMKVRPQAVCL